MANDEKIPVTILTGFLGAGKTTLLNRILTENHGRRIGVIENEFGEVGVDQNLVINANEEIFEMNNGCICCTVRGDLIRVLGNLTKRRDKFDRVVVETTGLADPGPVAQTFFMDAEIQSEYALDAIVTLVDCKHLALHIDESREAKEQIAFGDVLILNKTDLVSEIELERLENRVRRMNGMARIVRAKMATVPMEEVLDVGGFDLERALERKPTLLEPEYPFEYVGVYELGSGPHSLVLRDGPDSSMSVALIPVASAEEAVGNATNEVMRLFSTPATAIKNGGRLRAGATHFVANLTGRGEKRFSIAVESAGTYALYTEHLPEEFNLRLGDGADALVVPVWERRFVAAHSHDNSVTSVGIEAEGAVDNDKLNRWLGKLLRENGADIFRSKGILNVAGEDKRFVFQGVHMLLDAQAERPWGRDKRFNQLVFIGRKLDRDALTAGFRSCLQ